MNHATTRVLLALYEGATLIQEDGEKWPCLFERGTKTLALRPKVFASLVEARLVDRQSRDGGFAYPLNAKGRAEAKNLMQQRRRR